MKQVRGSLCAKIAAWILAGVSVLGFAAGLCLIAVLLEWDVYTKTKEDMTAEFFERYSDRYSAIALYQMGTGENEGYFADKNFRYGIVRAENLEELLKMDLNAADTYEERNFSGSIDPEKAHLFAFDCSGAIESYSNQPDSLWGHYWISEAYGNESIEAFVYDRSSGILYSETEKSYYPVKYVCFEAEVWDNTDDTNKRIVLYYRYDAKRRTYFREELTDSFHVEMTGSEDEVLHEETVLAVNERMDTQNDMILHIFCTNQIVEAENYDAFLQGIEVLEQDTMTFSDLDGTIFDVSNWEGSAELFTGISSVYINNGVEEADLTESEKTISDSGTYWMDLDLMMYHEERESDMHYVLSFVNQPLTETGSWNTDDLYVKTIHLMEFVYYMRYRVIWITAAFFLILLLSVSFLLYSAGNRKNTSEISVKWINKMPLEINMSVISILILVSLWIDYEIANLYNGVIHGFWLFSFLLFLLCGFYLLLAFAMDLAVRIKRGKWWRTTILYRCYCFLVRTGRFFQSHFSLLWKLVLGFAVLLFLEFVSIIFMYNRGPAGILLWILLKAAVLALLLKCAGEMLRLKEAGEHIAAGDLQYQADTSKMMFDFKKHGENLNSVNVGLSKAVNEKIKSERFKTELITNVSHDIKTPLTSIINYVDLLKKEELENETLQEYIEVLDRQSNRLKKLIEDLMEASKASTGNLEVTLEKLEAGVFMVQTVGEFEEKTKELNLDLIIKKPEEPIYILADGRHFWRVIDNLMNNICKYAQPYTRVYIDLDRKEEKAGITFRNTSKFPLNISSDELMERFVRGDSSRNTEGNGLGLSIAGSLMELMHGEFELVVDGDLFKVILTFEVLKEEEPA